MKRLRGRVGRDAILDLEQDLLLYLCSLPEKSKFRQREANGQPNGCADVIECFDPARHFGATAGRFHNFVSLCLGNRLNTILSAQRRSPLHHSNNASICGSEPETGSSEQSGEVSEEYLLNHSRAFAAEHKKRDGSGKILLGLYIGEFVSLAGQEAPETAAVLEAIRSTGTFKEAQRMVGLDSYEFRKHRQHLSILKDRFLEARGYRNAGRDL
jgi:hypothetical protein